MMLAKPSSNSRDLVVSIAFTADRFVGVMNRYLFSSGTSSSSILSIPALRALITAAPSDRVAPADTLEIPVVPAS